MFVHSLLFFGLSLSLSLGKKASLRACEPVSVKLLSSGMSYVLLEPQRETPAPEKTNVVAKVDHRGKEQCASYAEDLLCSSLEILESDKDLKGVTLPKVCGSGVSTLKDHHFGYLKRAFDAIDEAWRSCSLGSSLGAQLRGVVVLEIVLLKDGNLESLRLVEFSGSPELAERSLELVREAFPLPVFPESFEEEFFVLKHKLSY